jgi:hypothetical protein
MFKKPLIGMLPFMLLVVVGCAPRIFNATSASKSNTVAASSEPRVEVVDFQVIIKRVQKYIARLDELTMQPDPYLTDFFGYQVMKSVPYDQMIADLIPEHGVLQEKTSEGSTIRLRKGSLFDFRDNIKLSINGSITSSGSFAIYSAKNDEETDFIAGMLELRSILHGDKLKDRYLVPNPYFRIEQVVRPLLPAPKVSFQGRTDLENFGTSQNAVQIIPDNHNKKDGYNFVMEKVTASEVEWLAIEMLSVDLQKELDSFLKEPENSAAYQKGRQALLHYYESAWHSRFGTVEESPEKNPYFLLLELARKDKKSVYALDAEQAYIGFRFGEQSLGHVTRNVIWANAVPTAGRGIVFGGGAHFTDFSSCTMIDFLKKRNPKVEIFSPNIGN